MRKQPAPITPVTCNPWYARGRMGNNRKRHGTNRLKQQNRCQIPPKVFPPGFPPRNFFLRPGFSIPFSGVPHKGGVRISGQVRGHLLSYKKRPEIPGETNFWGWGPQCGAGIRKSRVFPFTKRSGLSTLDQGASTNGEVALGHKRPHLTADPAVHPVGSEWSN